MKWAVKEDRRAFRSAWWLFNGHLQSLWPALLRPKLKLSIKRERLELDDGDFIDLDHCQEETPNKPTSVVVILHGLEGSIESPYVRGLMKACAQNSMKSVLYHFRGCSGEANRLPRAYHSGETGDLSKVLQHIKMQNPELPIFAVGYSLGGNVLLKYLGEGRNEIPLQAAVAVSVPFELHLSADRMNRGFSRLYQWHLLRTLRKKSSAKALAHSLPFTPEQCNRTKSFWQFDDLVTAPLHGFEGAADYYKKCSSRNFLRWIQKPTLLLQAIDDPFLQPAALPRASELPDCVELELSPKGGHVGFVSGLWPWRSKYWLEQRIPRFLIRQQVTSPQDLE